MAKDLRWSALRILMAELLSDAPMAPELNGKRVAFERLVGAGASVRDIAVACEMSRDEVVAALARMASGDI